MNNKYTSIVFFLIFSVLLNEDASAQAFKQGSLLVSVSEGSAHTRYTTASASGASGNNDVLNQGNVNGDRDPLTLEYGLTSHWGLGVNLGTDILYLNPAPFYNFHVPTGKINAIMSEFTFDGHYHFFVTRRTDLSGFASVGISSISFKGHEGDHTYQYDAGGAIIRVGAQARYYVCRRFGLHAMLSTYSSSYSSQGAKNNTVGNNYYTSIRGRALEFGICYRFLK